jgi:flagellar hook-basal body complex protein FliE
MNWNAIQAHASISAIGKEFPADLAYAPVIGRKHQAPGVEFGQMVSNGITQVNEKLMASQVDLQRLATGDVQNLHQVMMGLEETRLSFQLLLQVRNRMLEAYQDVMKMQI